MIFNVNGINFCLLEPSTIPESTAVVNGVPVGEASGPPSSDKAEFPKTVASIVSDDLSPSTAEEMKSDAKSPPEGAEGYIFLFI